MRLIQFIPLSAAPDLENDNSIPFLDVLVTHDDTGFSTSLYRKKTYTSLYSDFDSLAPDKYKTNLISVLIFRAFQICSSYVRFHQEITRIKDILCKNRFPKTLINRIIKSFLDKKYETKTKEKVPENEKDVVIFCMLYLGHYSLQVKTKLNKLVKRCYPDIDFKVIFRCHRLIISYFPFKDRLSTLLCSGVVYKLECPDCNPRYYRKTSRHLATRGREHLGVNKVGKKIKVTPSAISEHIDQCGHNASIENFSILNRTNNNSDLVISVPLVLF